MSKVHETSSYSIQGDSQQSVVQGFACTTLIRLSAKLLNNCQARTVLLETKDVNYLTYPEHYLSTALRGLEENFSSGTISTEHLENFLATMKELEGSVRKAQSATKEPELFYKQCFDICNLIEIKLLESIRQKLKDDLAAILAELSSLILRTQQVTSQQATKSTSIIMEEFTRKQSTASQLSQRIESIEAKILVSNNPTLSGDYKSGSSFESSSSNSSSSDNFRSLSDTSSQHQNLTDSATTSNNNTHNNTPTVSDKTIHDRRSSEGSLESQTPAVEQDALRRKSTTAVMNVEHSPLIDSLINNNGNGKSLEQQDAMKAIVDISDTTTHSSAQSSSLQTASTGKKKNRKDKKKSEELDGKVRTLSGDMDIVGNSSLPTPLSKEENPLSDAARKSSSAMVVDNNALDSNHNNHNNNHINTVTVNVSNIGISTTFPPFFAPSGLANVSPSSPVAGANNANGHISPPGGLLSPQHSAGMLFIPKGKNLVFCTSDNNLEVVNGKNGGNVNGHVNGKAAASTTHLEQMNIFNGNDYLAKQ